MTRLTRCTLELVEAIGKATRDEGRAARCAQITLAINGGGMPDGYEKIVEEMFK